MIKFGISSSDLESSASAIGMALQEALSPHESSFRGGNYFRCETASATLFLQLNRDLIDEEPFEESWPQDQLVLYIYGIDHNTEQRCAGTLRELQDPKAIELE